MPKRTVNKYYNIDGIQFDSNEVVVACQFEARTCVILLIQMMCHNPPARLLDVVVMDNIPHGTVKVVAGRYCLVSDMQGVAIAAEMFKNRDKRLYYHTDGWYEVFR